MRSFWIPVRDDGLILRGKVGSHYGKQVIQDVEMPVSELAILGNGIEVKPNKSGTKNC